MEGTKSQEDNLYRRSDIYNFLVEHGSSFYPLGRDALISKGVSIFRAAETQGYEMLPEPFKVCVISSTAPCDLELRLGTDVFTEASHEEMKTRIITIFTTAKMCNCDIVVLPAFGCVGSTNPPRAVAEVFHEVLTTKFGGVFSKIIFSIIDDLNEGSLHNPQGNFEPFHRVFHEQSIKVCSSAMRCCVAVHL